MAEREVDVVTVRWYERAGHAPDIVTRWLAAPWRHLPEAVPRRFGDVEPLRGRFEKAGENGLRRAYGQAVSGGWILDRGVLHGPAQRPGEPYLAPMGDWLGLPPRPPA